MLPIISDSVFLFFDLVPVDTLAGRVGFLLVAAPWLSPILSRMGKALHSCVLYDLQ